MYLYLYRCMKSDIISGNLRAGEKLPSKRRLAENLSVSVITVENAYACLLAEGYLYYVEKSGYNVSAIETVPLLKKRFSDYTLPQNTPMAVDMRGGQTDTGSFPVSQWCRLTRKIMTERSEDFFRPCGMSGTRELRAAIADYMRRNKSIDVSPDCIVIGAGTEYLCYTVTRLLGRDKLYGMENPGYRKVSTVYESSGAACVYLPLDGKGLSMAAVRESTADVLHISPNHHFPTGRVTTAARRYELLAWAAEQEGRYIVEDDYDSEFRFDGHPLGSLFSDDKNGRVIYMNTFSKTISPSLRIGYLVLPPELMELYVKKSADFSCTVSTSEQLTLAEFISGGYYETYIGRMKKAYGIRRERFFQMIAESGLSEKLKIQEESAGLHFILALTTPLSDLQIKEKASENGIGLAFLSDCLVGNGDAFAHSLLVNYSNTEEAAFGAVLDFLYDIL